MGLDAALRKAAKAVLGKFGTAVIIRRTTDTAYNTTTRKMSPVTRDYDLKGRLDNYTDRELGFSPITETGLRVLANDRKLTIAAADLNITPDVSDKVIIAGEVFEIVNVKSVIATDQAAIYELRV